MQAEKGSKAHCGMATGSGEAPPDDRLAALQQRLGPGSSNGNGNQPGTGARRSAEDDTHAGPDGAVPGAGGASSLSRALHMSSSFIAAILVGAAIGWGIDSLFASKPFGLALFLMLGFAAGIVNMLRDIGHLAPADGRVSGQKAAGKKIGGKTPPPA